MVEDNIFFGYGLTAVGFSVRIVSKSVPENKSYQYGGLWETNLVYFNLYLPLGSNCEALRLGVRFILIFYENLILDPKDFCFIRMVGGW